MLEEEKLIDLGWKKIPVIITLWLAYKTTRGAYVEVMVAQQPQLPSLMPKQIDRWLE